MKRILAFGILLGLMGPCYPWGNTGHRFVAAVAWRKMKPSTRREIARILVFGDTTTGDFGGGFTHFDRINTNPALANEGLVTMNPNSATNQQIEQLVGPVFIQCATWPDDIRDSDASEQFQDTIEQLNHRLALDGQPTSQQSQCKSWHFFDTPLIFQGSTVVLDTSGRPSRNFKSNAVAALNEILLPNLTKLPPGATTDPNNRAVSLFFIEHLVGDLHQPLHCGTLYDGRFQNQRRPSPDPHDSGGNSFLIKGAKLLVGNRLTSVKARKLHSFWDAGVDNAIKADATIRDRDNLLGIADSWIRSENIGSQAENLDPAAWVTDGAKIAIAHGYGGIAQNQPVTQTYFDKYVKDCRRQAVLGGLRLARILDRQLGG